MTRGSARSIPASSISAVGDSRFTRTGRRVPYWDDPDVTGVTKGVEGMHRTGRRADPSSVRSWNEYAVVDALRTDGPQRVTELVGSTGLSQATLAEVLRGLGDKGWADVGPARVSGPGRPSQMFSARTPAGQVLGVDIGPHSVRAVSTDLAGEPVRRAECEVADGEIRRDASPVHEAVSTVVAECTDDASEVWVTAFALSGTVDDGGRLARSVTLPAWEGHRPGDLLGECIQGITMADNDVRAALWAEHRVGVSRGHTEVVQIQLGRRPSMALLLGGVPRQGVHHIAGDLSMSALRPTSELRAWRSDAEGTRDPLRHMVQAALDGDPTVLATVKDYIGQVAETLALAATLVDPSLVVVGGALTPLAHLFEDDLREHLATHAQIAPELGISQLDQFASAHGAALLATRDILSTLADPTTGLRPFTREAYTASVGS